MNNKDVIVNFFLDNRIWIKPKSVPTLSKWAEMQADALLKQLSKQMEVKMYVAEEKMYVTMTDNFIIGVDSDNGNILWQYDCKLYQGKPRGINPNTPIYYDGYIYVTSGYGKGGAKLKLSEDGSNVLSQEWANLILDCHHGGVVLVDGYIYGSNMGGNWVSLNWETGEVMYETEWIGKGSITFADNRLYCYEEKQGTVGLVKATPEKFELISSFREK